MEKQGMFSGGNLFNTIGGIAGALGPIGGIVGLLSGAINPDNSARKQDYTRFGTEFQPVQEQALANNQQDRAMLMQQNPEADRRAKAMSIREAQAGAMSQAANIGGGQVAASGLGGDVNSGQIAGIKAAAPVMQAMSPFAQALAQGFTEKSAQEMQQQQLMQQNTKQRADIGNMTTYAHDGVSGQQSPFGDIVSLLGGLPGNIEQGARAGSGIRNYYTE